jgi:hypothetical protein
MPVLQSLSQEKISVFLISSPTPVRAHALRVAVAGVGAHGAHHGLCLAAVLVHGTGIAHDGRSGDLGTLEGVVAHARHAVAVGQDFSGVLLVLGVLDEFLVLAGAALSDAAEGEDGDGEEDHAPDHAADDVLGLRAEAVPFLLDVLNRGSAVGAIELDGFRVAVELVSYYFKGRVLEWGNLITYLTTLMLCQLPLLSPH